MKNIYHDKNLTKIYPQKKEYKHFQFDRSMDEEISLYASRMEETFYYFPALILIQQIYHLEFRSGFVRLGYKNRHKLL